MLRSPFRTLLLLGLTTATTLLSQVAQAQQYRFPGADDVYQYYYPTAYKDHAGVDWNCGDMTYAGHNGSDYGAGSWSGMEAGRGIVAAAVGVVTATHDGEEDTCSTGDCPGGDGYGNHVWIVHPDGKKTVYGHMKRNSVVVIPGQVVQCGTPLGMMGSSGHSTGPHVHFAVLSMLGVWHDPFVGSCANPPSYWVDQGDYGGLPSTTCDGPPAVCATTQALSCGAVVQSRNDAAGSTSEHGHYGCGLEFVYSGSEIAYTFTNPVDVPITLSLTNLSADLSLHVLGSNACDGSDCVGYSDNSQQADEQVQMLARAGVTYVVVVDGYEGAVSDFQLAVTCPATPEPTDDAGHADASVEDAAVEVGTNTDAAPDVEEDAVTDAHDSSTDASAVDSGGDASEDVVAEGIAPDVAVQDDSGVHGQTWEGSSEDSGCGCALPGSRVGSVAGWIVVSGLLAASMRRRGRKR